MERGKGKGIRKGKDVFDEHGKGGFYVGDIIWFWRREEGRGIEVWRMREYLWRERGTAGGIRGGWIVGIDDTTC